MKSISILAVSLAVTSAIVASPADAQRRKKGEAAAPAVDPNARVYNFSKAGRPAIAALQTAVTAKDAAGVATNLAAAQAAASTPDDRYAIAQLQLKYALDTQNLPGQTAALNALAQSGGAAPTELPKIYRNLGALSYNAKDWAGAVAAYDRLIQLEPGNADDLVTLGEIRVKRGQAAEGVALIERAIATKTAAGQTADENWYKRAVGLSTDAKLTPQALKLAREWVTAYPTPQNWRDALGNYRFLVPLDEAAELDHGRLQRASGALQGERAYRVFAQILIDRRFYGEAKSVLDEGVAKRIIDPAKPEYKALITQATRSAATDRPTIAASEAKALSSAEGRIALNVADSYFGYADYAKAASFYRTALSKTGVDTNLINTRLGIALAMSGDKAGSTAAFSAVTGPRQELARFWMLWLSRRA